VRNSKKVHKQRCYECGMYGHLADDCHVLRLVNILGI
jgi:hypothetical protein